MLIPGLGIFIACGILLALMLMSDRQYGPGRAFLNQNVGEKVYDEDPGTGSKGVAVNNLEKKDGTIMLPEEQLAMAEKAANHSSPRSNAANCSTHCDCKRGAVCAKEAGKCVNVPIKIFCCGTDVCPSGAVCTTHEGKIKKCASQ